jgi:anti-anti-sigma factor
VDFFSALSLYAPHAHLLAKGELDAFAALALSHHLDEAIDRGCISYTVDASAVTFVDAGGLGVFVRLSNAVTPLGGTVTITAASPRFRQVAELVGLGTALGLDLIPVERPPTQQRTARGQGRDSSRRLTLVRTHPPFAPDPQAARPAEKLRRLRSAR